MSRRLYVGCKGPMREIFRADSTPTAESHGAQYAAVIGPFRTVAGATVMARAIGFSLIQTVADAERAARYNKES